MQVIPKLTKLQYHSIIGIHTRYVYKCFIFIQQYSHSFIQSVFICSQYFWKPKHSKITLATDKNAHIYHLQNYFLRIRKVNLNYILACKLETLAAVEEGENEVHGDGGNEMGALTCLLAGLSSCDEI